MAIFFLLLVTSVPLVLANFRQLLKNKYLWLIGLFLVWMAVCTVIGLARGNNRAVLMSDLKGFCYFAVLPAALCLIRNKQRLLTLMKIVVYSSLVLALCHVAVLIVYLLDKLLYHKLFLLGMEWQLVGLGSITDSIPRIFFRSVIYLLGGCGFSLYFYVCEEKKPVYPFVAGLTLFALLLSYTRSVYAGAAIAAVVCLLAVLVKADKQQKKRLLAFLGVTVLIFSVITGTFSVIRDANYFGFAIDRSAVTLMRPDPTNPSSPSAPSDATDPSDVTDPSDPTDPSDATDPSDVTDPSDGTDSPNDPTGKDEEEEQADAYLQITMNSDELRKKTMKEHLENIKRSPVFGCGLGTTVDFRVDIDGGLSEYFYLDLWAKTGIVGVLLYLMPVLYALYTWLRRGAKRYAWIWMGVLLGVMAVSFFNPYMNASLGIILYCSSMAAFSLRNSS